MPINFQYGPSPGLLVGTYYRKGQEDARRMNQQMRIQEQAQQQRAAQFATGQLTGIARQVMGQQHESSMLDAAHENALERIGAQGQQAVNSYFQENYGVDYAGLKALKPANMSMPQFIQSLEGQRQTALQSAQLEAQGKTFGLLPYQEMFNSNIDEEIARTVKDPAMLAPDGMSLNRMGQQRVGDLQARKYKGGIIDKPKSLNIPDMIKNKQAYVTPEGLTYMDPNTGKISHIASRDLAQHPDFAGQVQSVRDPADGHVMSPAEISVRRNTYKDKDGNVWSIDEKGYPDIEVEAGGGKGGKGGKTNDVMAQIMDWSSTQTVKTVGADGKTTERPMSLTEGIKEWFKAQDLIEKELAERKPDFVGPPSSLAGEDEEEPQGNIEEAMPSAQMQQQANQPPGAGILRQLVKPTNPGGKQDFSGIGDMFRGPQAQPSRKDVAVFEQTAKKLPTLSRENAKKLKPGDRVKNAKGAVLEWTGKGFRVVEPGEETANAR